MRLIIAPSTLLLLSTSLVHADVSTFAVGVSVTSDDGIVGIDLDPLTINQIASPGQTLELQTVNPAFGPNVMVSSSVETVENVRTVTIRYEALGESFAFQPAVDNLVPPQGEFGGFALLFNVGFADTDWIPGGPVELDESIWGDGELIANANFTEPRAFLNPLRSGFGSQISPAQPGFFGGSAAPDMYEYKVTYLVVPAPSTGALALAGLAACRRRRA